MRVLAVVQSKAIGKDGLMEARKGAFLSAHHRAVNTPYNQPSEPWRLSFSCILAFAQV